MYLTGFADEASKSIEGQIQATKTLGWENIESRAVGDKNLTDVPDEEFERIAGLLADADIKVNCFGSAVMNWGKHIDKLDEDTSLEETKRAIPRMKKLGCKLIRVMSYAVCKDADGKTLADQMEDKRFSLVRDITKLYLDEGLLPVHENCMNYGGMGPAHTRKLLENVPGLKLVFDTGNPVFTPDYEKSEPWPGTSVR